MINGSFANGKEYVILETAAAQITDDIEITDTENTAVCFLDLQISRSVLEMFEKSARATLAFLVTATCVQAESFNFISDGEILATIEFQKMPAELEDFVSLTFTSAGENAFGFGAVYAGEFEAIESPGGRPRFIISESDGGLGGIDNDGIEVVSLVDHDPPSSEAFSLDTFAITAALERPDSIGTTEFFVGGKFLPVPEPRFFPISVLCLGLVMQHLRNRC